MKKAVLLSLLSSLFFWAAAAKAVQHTHSPDGPEYTQALNRLHTHMAVNDIVPTGSIERKGDTFEATAIKDGHKIRLAIDVKSGTVYEVQG